MFELLLVYGLKDLYEVLWQFSLHSECIRYVLNTRKSSFISYTCRTFPQQIQEVKNWALTMIDEGSSWPKIVPIENRYAEEIAKLVDDYWFSRYPRPISCIHDIGGEFIGQGFVELLNIYGVDPKPTIVKNPQCNGLHERMHLVLCEMLLSQKLFVPKESTTRREINKVLQKIAWAIRTSIHMITKYSPRQLLF